MFSFLTNKIYSIYEKMRGITALDEATLKPFFPMIKENLIEADVSIEIIDKIIENLKKRVLDVKVPKHISAGEYFAKEFYAVILHLLQSNKTKKNLFFECVKEAKESKKPLLLFLVGLQGAGKTTTVGKIIHLLLQEGKKKKLTSDELGVISLDYDRPAAQEQLKVVSKQLQIEYIETKKASHSIEAAQYLQETIENNQTKKKIIIVDTAGRLSVDTHMMNELRSLYTILHPKEILLIIDTMISQEGITVAKAFSEAVPCTGCIITKTDSDAPGGIILGISTLLTLPILYLTFGEKYQDIKEFDAASTTKKLIGMGEIQTLIKSAEEKIAKEEERVIEDAFKRGDITIDEFIKMITLLKKMGPLKQLFSMIPRSMLGGAEVNQDTFSHIEQFNHRIEILSYSMTKKEKRTPTLLLNNSQRIRRISSGSGISEKTTKETLDLFFKMRQAFNGFKQFIR
jgi:signal recognition particle subunit SRP54